MGNVWTLGVWTVREGREDDFVAAWTEMARQATDELDVTSTPTLLRNRERSREYISFGPWPNVEAVEQFRASAAFRAGQERMRELLEGFEPQTLDEVTVGV